MFADNGNPDDRNQPAATGVMGTLSAIATKKIAMSNCTFTNNTAACEAAAGRGVLWHAAARARLVWPLGWLAYSAGPPTPAL